MVPVVAAVAIPLGYEVDLRHHHIQKYGDHSEQRQHVSCRTGRMTEASEARHQLTVSLLIEFS
jgi:hypothetical protein